MTNNTTTPDLLPCPFCGGAPLIEDGENDRPWVIQCIDDNCLAQPFMDHADTKRQAIAAWNTRASTNPQPSQADVERLADLIYPAINGPRKAAVALAQAAIAAMPSTEALRAEVERLREVLRALELANDRLCGARPQRVYDAMIESGMLDVLVGLDDARQGARAALKGTSYAG